MHGYRYGFHILKVLRRTVPVFVFGDVKNARDLHLQLRQAAHVVVDEVPGWRIPGLPSTATKLAFTCKFKVKNKIITCSILTSKVTASLFH
jgi:hypothetical protein